MSGSSFNEQLVIKGLTDYLKARAATLADATLVIGLGDVVPPEGARLHVSRAEIEVVTAELCYLDLEMLVVCPAKQEDGTDDFRAACGFLRRALPPRDGVIRDALAAVIDEATDGEVTLHWYHHGETPSDPPVDDHRHQRVQGLRLALQGAGI